MSEMEYNKGRLIPTIIDMSMLDEDAIEVYLENGFELIDGDLYEVEWEVKHGELYGIARALVNDDGSIDFETYHYNGGGHWTECVESALSNEG